MEDAIEQVVSYFRHAAQGLEEKKQILCWGRWAAASPHRRAPEGADAGGAFYAIKGSPVNESPLGLFDVEEDGPMLEEVRHPAALPEPIMSPWAVKRLEEFGGDIASSGGQALPLILKQIGIAKTEPGDENNQDISSWWARSTSAS
jgi:serine protein kinase